MRNVIRMGAILALAVASVRVTAWAQTAGGMDHSSHASSPVAPAVTLAGQDAYAAMAAIVAALEADSTTDWSRVNIEALRQHLIVMNDVTLRARASQTAIAGGARMEVTGDGRVAESIRAMLHAHARMLGAMGPYEATVDDIPGGVRFIVTAANPGDGKTVAKIRALGFSGLLTLGAHHAEHHMALARGQAMMHQ